MTLFTQSRLSTSRQVRRDWRVLGYWVKRKIQRGFECHRVVSCMAPLTKKRGRKTKSKGLRQESEIVGWSLAQQSALIETLRVKWRHFAIQAKQTVRSEKSGTPPFQKYALQSGPRLLRQYNTSFEDTEELLLANLAILTWETPRREWQNDRVTAAPLRLLDLNFVGGQTCSLHSF